MDGCKALSKREEIAIREYVKGKLKDADIAHGFDHVECVVNLAKKIAKAEGGNFRIVVPAAYLHDIVPRGKVKSFEDHAKASAMEAETLLRKLKFSKDEISKIKDAIVSSSYESYEKGINAVTLEAGVVRDADWLDAIGARGIARVFVVAAHYGSPEMGRVEWDPENPVKLKMNLLGPDPSPIYHFFSKLLWLKDNMRTKTGRDIAKERHRFMVEFLKTYKSECETLK